jgi:hypothetical protein
MTTINTDINRIILYIYIYLKQTHIHIFNHTWAKQIVLSLY